MPHMASSSGRGPDGPLPLDEQAHPGQRIEVLRDELRVFDLDAELLLEESNELQHSERIDDAVAQEGLFVGELVHEEGIDDELPDAGTHRHPTTSVDRTAWAPRVPSERRVRRRHRAGFPITTVSGGTSHERRYELAGRMCTATRSFVASHRQTRGSPAERPVSAARMDSSRARGPPDDVRAPKLRDTTAPAGTTTPAPTRAPGKRMARAP